jgi:3'(2'), 5'-bisphosphate nucleotidase
MEQSAMASPSDDALARDLDFAVTAARTAGQRILAIRERGSWEGEVLADIGDQAGDGFLQGFIRGRYPDDGLLSEETKDSPQRLEHARCWIVDPLDGTKEFSQGREDWAVHVALAIEGRCAVGAVALPSLGRILWGVALGGREKAGVEGEGRLLPGDDPGPASPRVVVSRSHTPPWVASFCEQLGAAGPEPWGSAGYKTARILAGEADVYVHKVGLKEWDTCAPETVARALGWTVCRLRGEEHRYNQRDPKNHELVVCRPAWRDRVLAAIASSGALAD